MVVDLKEDGDDVVGDGGAWRRRGEAAGGGHRRPWSLAKWRGAGGISHWRKEEKDSMRERLERTGVN